MEVRDVTSGQKVALETSARPQANRKASQNGGKEVSSAPAQKVDKVDLSKKTGGVVIEKGDAVEKERDKQRTEPRPEEVRSVNAEKVNDTPLRRDYEVENGNLVVKFVDTQDNKIVKEIPAEESRRIKEAISKFRENESVHVNTSIEGENAKAKDAKEIDVTS
ncbi:hypothetical protein MNBD_NITROSPINAE02-8 [hydrothermal vent metagenome]|uniref:Flagellar protein FlaG n=1 Tax=hydrothermal vent metagenome TaxID=652676 RepID=A0A3B1DAL8_9ZZZZ